MDHQADMQPSTSYVATNDDTETDCLADDLEVDDRIFQVLKRKLQKLRDRSVDWENEDQEDRCFAEEERFIWSIGSQRNRIRVAGWKNKITAMLRIMFESSNACGRLERFIDRREQVKLCKSCRSEEAGTAIPKDPHAFEDFVCKTAKTINNISVKYRSAFYEDVWDDYLEDDEKDVLEAAVIAPEIPEKKPNIDAALEEFARQAENSEDEAEGDDCSDGPSEESPGEDNTEEAESLDPRLLRSFPHASFPQEKSDVTVPRDEKNADTIEAVAKDEKTMPMLISIWGIHKPIVHFVKFWTSQRRNSQQEVLSVSTDMPANSGDKDAYVWSWLQNKCSSNPYIPDDEPVLKRARYDDDEIGCAWKIATRGFLSHHVFEPRLLVRNPSPEDASIECKDPSKPVVLLLGWAGAKYSHVDKYAEIYNRQGYQTISFVSACYHYRIPNSRYGFYLSPLFRGIDAKPGDFRSYKDCPIIVHSFSMNCVQSLISLWKWTEAGQLKHRRYRIRGIIFDSAPVVTQAGPCAVAVVQSTPPIDGLEWIDPELRRKYINYMFMLRNAEAHPLCYLYPPIRAQLSQFYYMQNYMTLPQPQLYIYSEADEMVKHKSVTRFLEQRKEMTSDRLFCRIHPIFIILFSIQKNMSKHVWISSGEPNWP